MRYVIGVDGGGTKTTAAVVGDELGPVGQATTGPANHRSVGVETAGSNIAAAIRDALHAGDVALSDVAAVCLCLSGFDTDLDLPVPQRAMRALGYEGPTIMENDVVGAWAGATAVRPGIVIIAGTGSTGLGMNAQGELWRTDGWDYVLGDFGSGYAIGRAAIRAAMKALDGRAPATLLTGKLSREYSVQDAEAMRRLVDSTAFGKFEIAGFAVQVSGAAEEGDVTARDILANAGRELAEQAVAIIHRLKMADSEFPLATVGSVFKSTPWVTEPFRRAISQVAPHVHFQAPLHPPEIGAAILARRRLESGDLGSWTLGSGKRRITRSLTIAEASAQ